jgi:hypothetical protein
MKSTRCPFKQWGDSAGANNALRLPGAHQAALLWSLDPAAVGAYLILAHARAPIAPIPRQSRRGRRRTDNPSIPPRAATARGDLCARTDQRTGPRDDASGWLAVANTGERKARSAPARAARCRSAGPWAELVTKRRGSPFPGGPLFDGPRVATIHLMRAIPGQRPPRRCTPAPSAAARATSPATTRASRRSRQIRARSRPKRPRFG